MGLLLDTHIFLWFITGDRRLPTSIANQIRDPQRQVYLSVVSVWESVIKYQLGKLALPQEPTSYLPIQRERHQIATLAVEEEDVMVLSTLPALHRDPFDHLIICQALRHGLTLVTVDSAVIAYPVSTLSS